MTYGIDQCRKCGKSMPKVSGAAIDRYEESLKRPPTMSRPEWEAAGWKAAPTHFQLSNKFDGVCESCKYIIGQQRSKRWVALTIIVVAMTLFFGLIASIFLSGD